MATSKKLKLKLLVDREKKKVIFAESDKDFVDILCSFLTIPLGSIIRVLNKQSSLGCMDNLYDSIENLDESYLSTKACKEMLLRPLNACGQKCEDLILRIDESNPRTFFTCKKKECLNNSNTFISLVPKARCGCGEIMDFNWEWRKRDHRGPNGDGVFVRGMVNFIIGDDLCVMPISATNMHSVIERFEIKELDNIEETCFELDKNMLHDLLKRSLISKSPLSDMYFQQINIIDNPPFHSNFPKVEETDMDTNLDKVYAKLMICKSNNKILYVEAGEGFVDLLLSFLTFPLGCIVKLLSRFSSIGCIDNLYRSIETLSSDTKCIKSDAVERLLNPKLAAHFGHDDSLFPVCEQPIFTNKVPGCHSCFMIRLFHDETTCLHGVKHAKAIAMNPKLHSRTEDGGRYAKLESKLLITDDLQIKPFSLLTRIQALKKYKLDFDDLIEKEIDIDEHDALNLLRSCLTSQNPFYVFQPKMQIKRERSEQRICVNRKEKDVNMSNMMNSRNVGNQKKCKTEVDCNLKQNDKLQ